VTPPGPQDSLEARFAQSLGQLLGPDFPNEIGLAVSGGGDSMAMLGLAYNWARAWGVGLRVVTVDHGLRPESAAEAAMVAGECALLGLGHDTLNWTWDGTGNVQDAARRARVLLIEGWRGTIAHVLMAHTQDDLAETFLLRLARGSGVEGLSAMAASRFVATPDRPGVGYHILRPCLQMRRADLRHYATTLKLPFVDDPSNADPRFDRVKMRQALPRLEALGLSVETLTQTAHRLERARGALSARLRDVAGHVAEQSAAGGVTLNRDRFQTIEQDTQLRLLAAACMWVSGAEYRPRATALEALLDRILSGGGGTLIGVQCATTPRSCHIFREYDAIKSLAAPVQTGALWDGRWTIDGPARDGDQMRPLGEAIGQCPNWRDTGLARASLLASPSIWRDNDLIAAPVAGWSAGWTAQIDPSFTTYLLSH